MFDQHEISLPEHQAWFDIAMRDMRRHLLVFELGGVAMGFVNLYVSAQGKVADWGFYASPDAPRGTGRQLGRSALKYAFDHLELHKVCGQTLAYNVRSMKLHEHLGFTREGVLRDQHYDGQRHHAVVWFGLLRQEYQTEQNT